MRNRPGTRGLVLVAVLLATAAAWTMATEGPTTPRSGPGRDAVVQRGLVKVVGSVDVPELAGESLVSAPRPTPPRLEPMWALPGLAAALAAVCLLRRLRTSPPLAAPRVVLPGTGARRAPPVASFA
jgi:hypothetical protein